MNLPFSLRKHGGNQRAETIKERQSGYHSVYCAKYAQFTDSVLLHISESLRRGRHGYAAQRLRLRLRCGTRCLTQKRPLSACKGRPTAIPLFEAVAGLWSAPDYLTKEVSLPFCPSRGRGTFLPSADGKSQSIRKKRIPYKRICAFSRRYTAYPCTEPRPKLTASASSTCRMAFSSSEPIFSRRRRIWTSTVRVSPMYS